MSAAADLSPIGKIIIIIKAFLWLKGSDKNHSKNAKGKDIYKYIYKRN